MDLFSNFNTKDLSKISQLSKDWKSHFDYWEVKKGQKIFSESRVLECNASINNGALEINGKVQGSIMPAYEVKVVLGASTEHTNFDHFQEFGVSDCTCPVGFACKHATALCLKFFNQLRKFQHSPSSQNPNKNELSNSYSPLDKSQNEWLKLLGTPDLASNSYVTRTNLFATGTYKLIYMLSLSQSAFMPEVINLKVGAVHADGDSNYIMAIPDEHFDSIGSNKNFQIDRLDFSILLKAKDSAYRNVYMRSITSLITLKPEDAELLIDLVTRRSLVNNFWKDFQHYSLGTDRKLNFKWRNTVTGGLMTAIESVPISQHIFGAQKLIFVDKHNFQLGRVDATGQKFPAQFWLNMPLVKNKQMLSFAVAIKNSGIDKELKPPIDIPNDIALVAPKAVLRFTCLPHQIEINQTAASVYFAAAETKMTMQIPAVELLFDYDGIRVGAKEEKAYIQKTEAQDTRKYLRNREEESKFKQMIQQNDLYPYMTQRSNFLPNQKLRDKKFASYYVYNEYYSSAESYIDTWKYFLRIKLPALLARGVLVEYSEDFPFLDYNGNDINFALSESSSNWFDLELGIDIDGQKISLIPILARALELSPDYFKFEPSIQIMLNGKIIAIPGERISKMVSAIGDLLDTPSSLKHKFRLPLTAAAFLVECVEEGRAEFRAPKKISNFRQKLSKVSLKKLLPPKSFKGSLRDYQQTGAGWLNILQDCGLGGVLADDMGLGKTIQALACMAELHKQNSEFKFLVVAPTSVVFNWQSETQRFLPKLRVNRYIGKDRTDLKAVINKSDLLITSYPILLKDAEQFLNENFKLVIFDEAQVIKNPSTLTYSVASGIKADSKFICTGTPIENNLEELWAHLNLSVPGLLGTKTSFRKHFRKPIEKDCDSERKKILAQRIRPFLLRRKREDVLQELPDVVESVQRIEITGAQLDLYETIRSMMDKKVRDLLKSKTFARSRIEILDALLKLRQVCCHPKLIKSQTARKNVASAKLEALLDLAQTLHSEGRKVLIFSQFTEMLDLIAEAFRDKDYLYEMLTGQTKDRVSPVKKFQNGEIPFFLISLKAGGVGLNLTAADTVILFDPWWNPAVEQQALSRAHRIGQKNSVLFYKLVIAGSVEEKILKLQSSKAQLAKGIIEDGESHLSQLNEEMIKGLFMPVETLVEETHY
jgi:SNF2 family DNA or RNA helicase